MSTLKICMFALLGVSSALVIKQWKGELLPLLRLAVVLGIGTVLLSVATPLITYVKGLLGEAELSSPHAEILLKALGIAVLTSVCANVCRECGETSAAGGVELTGKLEILLLSLPLINEILGVARELFALGGG